MRRVGLAVAVGNAVREVKETAHYTTKALAGHAAIRETVELILKSKGIWDSIIDKRAPDKVYPKKSAGVAGLELAASCGGSAKSAQIRVEPTGPEGCHSKVYRRSRLAAMSRGLAKKLKLKMIFQTSHTRRDRLFILVGIGVVPPLSRRSFPGGRAGPRTLPCHRLPAHRSRIRCFFA
jgi:hypothetical protein